MAGEGRREKLTRTTRLTIALSVATLFHCYAFTFAALARWPLLWYYPVERRWGFSARADMHAVLGMDLFGRMLYGFAAGSIFGLTAWWLAGKFGEEKSADSEKLPVIFIFAVAAFLAAVIYFAISLWLRQPRPLSISG